MKYSLFVLFIFCLVANFSSNVYAEIYKIEITPVVLESEVFTIICNQDHDPCFRTVALKSDPEDKDLINVGVAFDNEGARFYFRWGMDYMVVTPGGRDNLLIPYQEMNGQEHKAMLLAPNPLTGDREAVLRSSGPYVASFQITMKPEEPWLEGE